jgi:hypothetical protein
VIYKIKILFIKILKMTKLLNRIAWAVSIMLGFLTLFLLLMAFDVLADVRWAFDDDVVFIWIILILIF